MSGPHRVARAGGSTTRSEHDLSMAKQLIATTGRSFDDWFDALDDAGAENWPHWRIKRYLGGKRKNDEWWASAVADAYERARGITTGPTGSLSAKATKTLPAPPADVWLFIDDEAERRAWLDVELEECDRPSPHTLHAELADGSHLTISLRPAPSGEKERSHVTIRHSGLAHEAELEETKAFWRSALGGLATIVAEERASE